MSTIKHSTPVAVTMGIIDTSCTPPRVISDDEQGWA